jgi:hypothetical protein
MDCALENRRLSENMLRIVNFPEIGRRGRYLNIRRRNKECSSPNNINEYKEHRSGGNVHVNAMGRWEEVVARVRDGD